MAGNHVDVGRSDRLEPAREPPQPEPQQPLPGLAEYGARRCRLVCREHCLRGHRSREVDPSDLEDAARDEHIPERTTSAAVAHEHTRTALPAWRLEPVGIDRGGGWILEDDQSHEDRIELWQIDLGRVHADTGTEWIHDTPRLGFPVA